MEDFKVPVLKTDNIKEIIQENVDQSKSKAIQKVKPEILPENPYKIPIWSAQPPKNKSYKFEVLKSGQIIDEICDLQEKATWTFGRLPQNDIEMAHPTISRFHTVLQYRPHTNNENEEKENPPEGWYIYDLNSTHGTFINKQRVPGRVYIRIRVGHMLRLGTSSRTYILQGPCEDEEAESEFSVTELKAQRQNAEKAIEERKQRLEEIKEKECNDGINWGMAEDADEETDLMHNPYALTTNEELFLDDPKRTLRGYFEREGLDLEYKCDEMSAGTFVCRVSLPLDDSNGRPIIAEVIHKGKKKECVVQCAQEACRLLDRYGVLRQANQEPLRRKQIKKDSDSDDDDFLDRTGDIARKKERKSNQGNNLSLTYDDLLKKSLELEEKILKVQQDIQKYQNKEKQTKDDSSNKDVDLDDFMKCLDKDEKPLDKMDRRKLRLEEQQLKIEYEKNKRLLELAKPLNLSAVQYGNEEGFNDSKTNNSKKKNLMAMIGKRTQFSKFKIIQTPEVQTKSQIKTTFDSDEEEMEKDDEEEEEEKNTDVEVKINNKETKIVEEKKENKIYGPIILSSEILPGNDDEKDEIETENIELKSVENASETVIDVAYQKKQRSRHRQRMKRQQSDINELDEHETSEKYAKWVPPSNQTGDGLTELNKKYGY